KDSGQTLRKDHRLNLSVFDDLVCPSANGLFTNGLNIFPMKVVDLAGHTFDYTCPGQKTPVQKSSPSPLQEAVGPVQGYLGKVVKFRFEVLPQEIKLARSQSMGTVDSDNYVTVSYVV